MRRAAALAAMTATGLIGLAGIALLLYGGYLAAITTDDGDTPYEASAFVVCIVGMAVTGAAIGISRLVQAAVGADDFDPVDDVLIVASIVAGLLLAAFAVRVLTVML